MFYSPLFTFRKSEYCLKLCSTLFRICCVFGNVFNILKNNMSYSLLCFAFLKVSQKNRFKEFIKKKRFWLHARKPFTALNLRKSHSHVLKGNKI